MRMKIEFSNFSSSLEKTGKKNSATFYNILLFSFA